MKEYMIVKVQFNVSSKTCTGKLYTFLAYEEYKPGDVVVVDTQNGFQLATVEGTASKIPDGIPTGGLKEIVCKVDFTAWNERRERAKRMNELQCMMNNRVRDLQETALFEMLACSDEGPAVDGKGNLYSLDGKKWETFSDDELDANVVLSIVISAEEGELPSSSVFSTSTFSEKPQPMRTGRLSFRKLAIAAFNNYTRIG